MTTNNPYFELAYVSTLAPDAPIAVVADIARRSRAYNELNQLTGLIVFDGERFAQQLEGDEERVLEVAEKIRQDARHVDMRIFYRGKLASRRFKKFGLGFADVEKYDLGPLEHLKSASAINFFVNLVPTLDWTA